MYRSLFGVFLLVLVASTEVFLSPPIPPTAFVGEYYTIHFRVLGAEQPEFFFKKIPAGFKGHANGRLEGTPSESGTFNIVVSLSGKGIEEVKQVALRVRHSVTQMEQITTEMSIIELNSFVVELPSTSLTFTAGQDISLQLTARNGQQPFQWSYLYLPGSLEGTSSGRITGVISEVGYYSFSVSVVDNEQKFADSYITLNIQSAGSSSSILEVPNRNVPMRYNIEQVQKQQQQAESQVYSSILAVAKTKQSVEELTKKLNRVTLATQFAKAQETKANHRADLALRYRNWAQSDADNKFNSITKANNFLALVVTNLKNFIGATLTAQQQFAKVMQQSLVVNKSLQNAQEAMVLSSQQKAQSIEDLKSTLSDNIQARKTYDFAFDEMSEEKKNLQVALDTKAKSDTVVDSAHGAVDVMNQVNDDAQGQLTKTTREYTSAFVAMNNANQLVAKTRNELVRAEYDLGTAKFDMQQALNTLYVAQARKAQADKATSIVQAQTSTLPSSQSDSIFGGCQQHAYPTISGSAYVSKANNIGYRLSSNSTMLYGECTDQEEVRCEPGELIEYEGYLKEGYIHAVWYRRARK